MNKNAGAIYRLNNREQWFLLLKNGGMHKNNGRDVNTPKSAC
jgi:hypothetical protein